MYSCLLGCMDIDLQNWRISKYFFKQVLHITLMPPGLRRHRLMVTHFSSVLALHSLCFRYYTSIIDIKYFVFLFDTILLYGYLLYSVATGMQTTFFFPPPILFVFIFLSLNITQKNVCLNVAMMRC